MDRRQPGGDLTPDADGEESLIGRYTSGLERSEDGVWYAGVRQRVSYPDEGAAACAALEDGSFWFRHRNRVILAAFERFPPPGLPIFDLGGGNGYVARGLVEAGFETVLVEPGESAARTAVRRGLRNVVCATVETAGFRPGSLPAAGMFDVLEHIDDHHAFLRTVRRILTPGGRLYLTVPAFGWLWSNEDEYAGHYRRYTPRTLRAALAATGFRVEYVGCFFASLTSALFALRTVPSALGLRRSPSEDSWRREHGSDSPRTGRLMGALLGFEVDRVRRGLRLPVGTSCLCVARAVEQR